MMNTHPMNSPIPASLGPFFQEYELRYRYPESHFFAGPETIQSKLEWYRLGAEVSERQWRDILGVLKTRALELDLAYLNK